MSKILKVKWIDSHSPNQNAWVNEDDIQHGLMEIDSIGWVIFEDKKSITLVSSLTGKDSEQVGGVISIPKCAILKKTKLG